MSYPYWLDYHNWETPRWKTAVGSRKISFPMRRTLELGIITADTQLLDFGCGRNNDVLFLQEKGIRAVGFDPYWQNNTSLLQPTDVVSCIYVLNTIEREQEIPEVIQYCWELTRKSLILAIRTGDDCEERTSIGTYQYYWKSKSWQQFIQELGFDAEFPEAGIAVIHKTICYNNSSFKNSTNMNIKELRKFLSVTPDKDGSGAPITLEYEHGIFHLTYKKSGMLIKLPYTLLGSDEKWSIIVDHTALMDAIASIKSKEDITLSVDQGDLVIHNREFNITVPPWGKNTTNFDPDTLELDSQVIQLDGKRWADIQAAARIAKSNKKGVNPPIVAQAIKCYAWSEYLTVSAWSETVSCSRSIKIDEITEKREFILPLEAIDLVASMKPSQVVMTLDYKFQQLLVETDVGYILVDIPQEKYPDADGIQKGGSEATVQVKRKELLDAVKSAVEAGAKNITLVFDNNTVIVEAAKTKKQEIPAELADDSKRFTATIKVAANALLDALKTVAATKILMHFPAAAANALIIDTVTGVMYVFVVTVKVAAQLIESAADALKKPEPQREVVASGQNSDGTPFVVEAVEVSPLTPEPSVEQKEEKKAKLQDEYGDKAEVAEAALEVADLREKVRDIVKEIDEQIKKLRSLPQPSNTAGINGLDKVQDNIQDDAKRQIAELSVLHRELSGIVSETENVETALDVYETEFTLEGLREVSLKLTWWGGRTLQLLWKEESQWLPQMRLSEPVVAR